MEDQKRLKPITILNKIKGSPKGQNKLLMGRNNNLNATSTDCLNSELLSKLGLSSTSISKFGLHLPYFELPEKKTDKPIKKWHAKLDIPPIKLPEKIIDPIKTKKFIAEKIAEERWDKKKLTEYSTDLSLMLLTLLIL